MLAIGQSPIQIFTFMIFFSLLTIHLEKIQYNVANKLFHCSFLFLMCEKKFSIFRNFPKMTNSKTFLNWCFCNFFLIGKIKLKLLNSFQQQCARGRNSLTFIYIVEKKFVSWKMKINVPSFSIWQWYVTDSSKQEKRERETAFWNWN